MTETTTRRPSAPIWRLLKILTDGGSEGVEMSVIRERIGVTNTQVRNMIYRLRNHEGISVKSHRRARKDAAYFVEGGQKAPTGWTEQILQRLKQDAPNGVHVEDMRKLMSDASLRRSICLLHRAGLLFSKRAHGQSTRYWLTAEHRDAELALDAAAVQLKPERQVKKRREPQEHQKMKTMKTNGPRLMAIPHRTGPQVEVSYLPGYKHIKSTTPMPRFHVETAPRVVQASECRGWASAYGSGK